MNGCHVKPEQFFNLIFGFNDRYIELSVDANAPAGTVTKYLTTVPATEIWIIQGISAKNLARAATIEFNLFDGTTHYNISSGTQSALDRYYPWTGQIVLKAGDSISIIFYVTTAGDILVWTAHGYKMKLSQ